MRFPFHHYYIHSEDKRFRIIVELYSITKFYSLQVLNINVSNCLNLFIQDSVLAGLEVYYAQFSEAGCKYPNDAQRSSRAPSQTLILTSFYLLVFLADMMFDFHACTGSSWLLSVWRVISPASSALTSLLCSASKSRGEPAYVVAMFCVVDEIFFAVF